jgi:hypothetical protein
VILRRVAATAAAFSIALAMTGCSSPKPSGDTYCSVFSCPDSGGQASTIVDASTDSPWWCDNGVTATTTVPPPTYPADAMLPTTVRYVVPIVDFSSLAAGVPTLIDPRAIVVLACPGGECPDGGSTIATPPSKAVPAYQIDLPYNFTGSILITNSPQAPAGAPVYMPTNYIFGGPMVGTRQADGTAIRSPVDGVPVVNGLPIAPIDYVKLASFFMGLGPTMLDVTKGLLVARTLDCNGKVTSGVLLNVAGATGIPYTLESDYMAVQGPFITDTHAVAGYANMDQKNYNVTGTTPHGTVYGLVLAEMRANTLTEVEIRTDVPTQVGR